MTLLYLSVPKTPVSVFLLYRTGFQMSADVFSGLLKRKTPFPRHFHLAEELDKGASEDFMNKISGCHVQWVIS